MSSNVSNCNIWSERQDLNLRPLDPQTCDQNENIIKKQYGNVCYPHAILRNITHKYRYLHGYPHKFRTMIISLLCVSFLCAFTVHDGDTITKISYRLAYIDAPELKQTCHVKGKVTQIGWLSMKYLEELSRNRLDDCRVIGFDRYGRAIADCPFNMDMVRYGMAVCYDKYIKDAQTVTKCHQLQDDAKAMKLGLWKCEDFVEPLIYRKGNK